MIRKLTGKTSYLPTFFIFCKRQSCQGNRIGPAMFKVIFTFKEKYVAIPRLRLSWYLRVSVVCGVVALSVSWHNAGSVAHWLLKQTISNWLEYNHSVACSQPSRRSPDCMRYAEVCVSDNGSCSFSACTKRKYTFVRYGIHRGTKSLTTFLRLVFFFIISRPMRWLFSLSLYFL